MAGYQAGATVYELAAEFVVHRVTVGKVLRRRGVRPLTTLVRVAGSRWTVEEDFQTGKELAGLDQRQVRRWTS